MANQQNIDPHQFKPGQSGNPAGRPPGIRNIATVLKELLEERDKKEGGKGEYGKPLAHELITLIFKKNTGGKYLYSEVTRLKALEQVVDRLEGKANLPISVSNNEDRPNFNIVFRNGDSIDTATAVQRNEPETD